jgi:hypothetical protein
MRVRCIRKCDYYIGNRSFWVSPEIGEVCTVEDEEEDEGYKYLFLVEYPGFAYDSKCFAVLPEPSADQLKEEEETVNLQPA